MQPVAEPTRSRFFRLIWLLPLAYSLHEVEEWNILDWYHRHWVNVGTLTETTVRTWLVFSSLAGFAVTAVARIVPARLAAHGILLFFGFPLLHAFLHIYWVFYFGSYSPGVVTSALLLIPSFLLVAVYAVRHGLVAWWFIVAVLALNLTSIVRGIRLGNTLPDEGLPWYRLSQRIAEAFLGSS